MNVNLNSLGIHCNGYSQIFFENLLTNQRFGVEIVFLITISTNYNHYNVINYIILKLSGIFKTKSKNVTYCKLKCYTLKFHGNGEAVMGICFIFGAGDGLPSGFKKEEDDIVIAADAGIKPLNNLGIKPDIAVGDFDSLGFVPACSEIIKHPVMKNDTDMLLAVKTGFKRGFNRFMLYGGAGGRPDHTFANLQTLNYIAEHGGLGFLDLCGFTATVIMNGELKFTESASGTVSVFALSNKINGVTLKGFLYPLENASLTNFFPLGVSNEFIGNTALIKVGQGNALVIWQGGTECLLI